MTEDLKDYTGIYQFNPKEGRIEELRNIRQKWQKSFLISNYIKYRRLDSPGKRQRVGLKNHDPTTCYLQKTLESDTNRLKGWKKIFYANRKQKEAGVAILISDKIDFKIKIVTGDKEGYYVKGQSIRKVHGAWHIVKCIPLLLFHSHAC